MPSLLELREQVRQILTTEFNGVSVDSAGNYSIRNESTEVFIRSTEQALANGTTRTLVDVEAPVLIGTPPSPALFEYVAVEGSYLFGSLRCAREQTGTVTVIMTHSLLGDYLDSQELLAAVYGVAVVANDLDDQLQARFGGQRYYEDQR